MKPVSGESLPEILAAVAAAYPQRGITVVDRRGKNAEHRAYPEVLAAARRAAGRLAGLGVGRDDAVLICLPTAWPALELWLGALFLEARPIWVAPAGFLGAAEAQVRKADAVAGRIGVRCLVAEASFKTEAEHFGAREAASRCVTLDQLEAVRPRPLGGDPKSDPERMAFLQLTSGSTGIPRAVMIPHRAAIHNARAIGNAITERDGMRIWEWTDSVVSWLPLYHDMGLVGCLIFSMVSGLDLVLLRPDAFLARPRLWLEWIGRSKRVLSPAPNFAYQLCLERLSLEELGTADLSGWKGAMTGAEMIRPETTQGFVRKFGAIQFPANAFRPCYGLAESTLAVTFDRMGQGVRTRPVPAGAVSGTDLREVVCTGKPVLDTRVRIVSPAGDALPEGTIGEIQTTGPSLFQGYFQDAEATAEAMRDGWLRSGDLGFLHQGELYLTGRTKDLLIVHGHNLMPHELEWVAEGVTGGGGAERCAAFSVTRGTEGEQAVLVVEAGERDGAALQNMEREIRVRIGRLLGLPLAEVVFVKRGQIPKTSSGKMQRGELRRRYLEGSVERIVVTS